MHPFATFIALNLYTFCRFESRFEAFGAQGKSTATDRSRQTLEVEAQKQRFASLVDFEKVTSFDTLDIRQMKTWLLGFHACKL